MFKNLVIPDLIRNLALSTTFLYFQKSLEGLIDKMNFLYSRRPWDFSKKLMNLAKLAKEFSELSLLIGGQFYNCGKKVWQGGDLVACDEHREKADEDFLLLSVE